jgi:hypothetical protein
MQTQGDEVHLDVDAARAGSTPNITRWVLTFSLIAVIVLLTAIWVIGAWSSDQNTQSVGAQLQASQKQARGANDSVVSDHADEMDAVTPGQSSEPQNMPNKNAAEQ